MSASKRDIESHKANTYKSLLSLKNVLIALGSLASIAIVVFASYRCFGSSESPVAQTQSPSTNQTGTEEILEEEAQNILPSNPSGAGNNNNNNDNALPADTGAEIPSNSADAEDQNTNELPVDTGAQVAPNSPTEENEDEESSEEADQNIPDQSSSNSANSCLMVIMNDDLDRTVYTFDPLSPGLEAKRLLSLEDDDGGDFRFSKDNKQVFFHRNNAMQVQTVETGSVDDLDLPHFRDWGFVLKNPGAKSIIYPSEIEHNRYRIRHVNLEMPSRRIRDYTHRCGTGHNPRIFGQFSDGSNILYQCSDNALVYVKNLKNPRIADKELFTLTRYQNFILSPDNSKVLRYQNKKNFWTIIDLSGPAPVEKKVCLNSVLKLAGPFSFSDGQKTLKMVLKSDADSGAYDLLTIDFENLLENDYSSEQSPFEINPENIQHITLQAA